MSGSARFLSEYINQRLHFSLSKRRFEKGAFDILRVSVNRGGSVSQKEGLAYDEPL